MKTRVSHFDRVVAKYYPAVFGIAVNLTDDPKEAVEFTRTAFCSAEKQINRLRSKTNIATVLFSAVLRAGLAAT